MPGRGNLRQGHIAGIDDGKTAGDQPGQLAAQISVNSFALQLEAVRRGLGGAALPRVLAQELIELFPELQLPDMEVYLVTRPQALKQDHIKCFLAMLEPVLLEALALEKVEADALGGEDPGFPVCYA